MRERTPVNGLSNDNEDGRSPPSSSLPSHDGATEKNTWVGGRGGAGEGEEGGGGKEGGLEAG